MRFLCACCSPAASKKNCRLEATATEVLSEHTAQGIRDIGPGLGRVALLAAPLTEPQMALTEVATSRNGRPGAGAVVPRLPAGSVCPAPPSLTLASCLVVASALQGGRGGEGVLSVSEVDSPARLFGHLPGASAYSLDTPSLREAWKYVSSGRFATSQQPGGPLVRRRGEGMTGGCWRPLHSLAQPCGGPRSSWSSTDALSAVRRVDIAVCARRSPGC